MLERMVIYSVVIAFFAWLNSCTQATVAKPETQQFKKDLPRK